MAEHDVEILITSNRPWETLFFVLTCCQIIIIIIIIIIFLLQQLQKNRC